MDSVANAHKAAESYLGSGKKCDIEEVGLSTINKTYIVKPLPHKECWFVLQRMHSIFTPELMQDIERITTFLGKKGMETPRVLRTLDGKMCVEWEKEWWRALSYIPGHTIQTVNDATNLESVGSLVGTFHKTLMEYNEPFAFTLPHFHDTEHYMKRMVDVVTTSPHNKDFKDDMEFILAEYKKIAFDFSSLPKRVIHADLKISNIRFDDSGVAQSLIDLDTLMSHHVAVDLGDGLRSWCALGNEDTEDLAFSLERYEKACKGYLETATFLTPEEKASLPKGMLLITLELASRFITDACEQNYFLLQKEKYENLYEQNKTKARNQLSLYRSMMAEGISA